MHTHKHTHTHTHTHTYTRARARARMPARTHAYRHAHCRIQPNEITTTRGGFFRACEFFCGEGWTILPLPALFCLFLFCRNYLAHITSTLLGQDQSTVRLDKLKPPGKNKANKVTGKNTNEQFASLPQMAPPVPCPVPECCPECRWRGTDHRAYTAPATDNQHHLR